MKPLVIYHSPCTDGWTAAWAVAKAHGGAEHVDFHPAQYGDDPPDVTGRDVIMVDVSYPRADLVAMFEAADSLLVLDHHKSAAEDLDGLEFARFDMSRSGAGMAWDFFHPDTPRPQLVRYVEDRDIWAKKLPHTEEVSAAIGLVGLGDYDAWEALHAQMEGIGIRSVMLEGVTVLRYRQRLVTMTVERAGLLALMGRDEVVPGVVCDPLLRSETGHQLVASGQFPYSVTFRESADGFSYSLRSGDHLADVSAIAKGLRERFACVTNGGGHRNAAGLHSNIPIHTWVDKERANI